MRPIICLLTILFLFTLGCAAWQNDPNNLQTLTDEQVKAYNDNPENKDKIICKEETPIGSNLPTRNCYKESTIKKQSDSDQDAMNTYLRQSQQQSNR